MAKNLAFGGKGPDLVVGSRVSHKSYGPGEIQEIRFNTKMIPTAYRVRWDTHLVSWVHRKDVSKVN